MNIILPTALVDYLVTVGTLSSGSLSYLLTRGDPPSFRNDVEKDSQRAVFLLNQFFVSALILSSIKTTYYNNLKYLSCL